MQDTTQTNPSPENSQKEDTNNAETMNSQDSQSQVPPSTHSNSSASADSVENEIEQLKAQLSRSQADYQNLKMRTERDRVDMTYFITEKILRSILPQIDNLNRALEIKKDTTDDSFVDGIRSVQSGLIKFLESNWVSAFSSLWQEVNPDRHEVLSNGPGEEGKIIQEFETGYTFWDKILRHAKVIVGNWEDIN